MKRISGLALLIGLSFFLSACSGLGGEPPIVATIAVNAPQPTFDPTVLAEIHAQVTPNATAPAEVLGTVSGQVINGTRGAALPADLEVELHSVDRAFNDIVLKTKPDADGKFVFKDVPISAERSYFTAAVIDGRYFASDPIVGDPRAPTLELPFKIYERTADPSVLKVSNVVTQVSPDGDSLFVVQIIRFENTSDRIFSTDEPVGADRFASVRVQLPDGAILLGFAIDEARYHVENGVITDTQPVYPESRHIVHYRYRLPYQPSGTRLALKLQPRIDGIINLFVNPTDLKVTAQAGDQSLPAQGVQGGSDFMLYGGTFQLPPGTTLVYTLSGALPQPLVAEAPITAPNGSLQPFAIALIVGGLLLIGIGLVLLVRGTRSMAPARDQQQLIAALAQLDEQYRQGKLSQAAYARKRAALKAQLAKLMREE